MLRYHNITKDDMLNGEGLRVVLWVSGCLHHCPDCQNPITWDVKGGIPFDDMAKDEIYELLEKDYIKGITFSGGDPLHPANRKDIGNLMKEIKEKYPDKDIWCYTGYLYEEVKDLELMQYIDVLVDGRFEKEMFDVQLEWVGSANQRVIRLKKMKDSACFYCSPLWIPKTTDEALLSAWRTFHKTEFLVSKEFMEKHKSDEFHYTYDIYKLAKSEGELVCERIVNA